MSEISKQALLVDNSISFPNNNAGAITPSDLRAFNVNVIQSTVNQTEYTENSSSWNSKISQLNAFTASQQPSFTALNSFTASQIITNTNLNAFTQSANQELDSLSAWTGSWNTWTSSINEIRDDGVLQGYSTRFFFNGLVSASIVQNVGGPIANVTVEQDGTKLNTSSFDSYVTSTNAWTASAKVSITNINSATASLFTSISNLNAYTASDDTSTDALNAFTSSQLTINSGYNSFTASQLLSNNRFATTGSNTFNGNQTINGTLTTSGNIRTNDSLNVINQFGTVNVMRNTNFSGSQYPLGNMIVAPNQYPGDVYGGWIVTTELGNQSGLTFLGMVASTYSPQYGSTLTPMFIGGGNNPGGNDTAIGFPTNGHADHWKTSNFKYGVNVTGSVLGNVVPLSITSQTASMNLSSGSFFTLTLVSGSTTHLTTSNIRAGQTINLLVTQASVGSGSLSYNSTFKFTPGNQYTASVSSSAQDILTFITFDNSNVYASAIKNLV